MDDRRQARLKLYAAVWIGGLIVGFLVFAFSLVVRSNSAGQLGLLLIVLGMAGSLMARINVFQAVGSIGLYAIVSLGLRIVAIGILIYLAIKLHLS
jgi:hypothetical protein